MEVKTLTEEMKDVERIKSKVNELCEVMLKVKGVYKVNVGIDVDVIRTPTYFIYRCEDEEEHLVDLRVTYSINSPEKPKAPADHHLKENQQPTKERN